MLSRGEVHPKSGLDYEGTWQEISTYATKFKFGDRRLRLIGLDTHLVEPA